MSGGGVEWKVNMPDGTSAKLERENDGVLSRAWMGLNGVVGRIGMKTRSFLEKAWSIGVSEPQKVVHCLKVGLALSLVSLFYFMRPLYQGVGGNAMWAVMTVVVVFEYPVGAMLSKCINRVIGTFFAGSLAIGVHWIATKSGGQFEPIILGVSVFLLAAVATFTRFIPTIKARFDYGALIFILTFSLVAVSGYRIDELFELVQTRLSTVAIGTSICILISMLFYPVWAGTELHHLINRNMEKLADSLDGCVSEYFIDNDDAKKSDDGPDNKLQGYICVLNSKATEESLANFARWEPTHGNFNFGHPWKQYLKIGAAMRNCACYVESLNSCIDSEIQVPEYLKKNLSDVCMRLTTHCSKVLKELAVTMKTMTKSPTADLSVGEMNFSAQELQNALKSLPNPLLLPPPPLSENVEAEAAAATKPSCTVTLIDILPLATAISLLIEIATRIERIADEVDELATLAEFDSELSNEKSQQQNQSKTDSVEDDRCITMKALQKV